MFKRVSQRKFLSTSDSILFKGVQLVKEYTMKKMYEVKSEACKA